MKYKTFNLLTVFSVCICFSAYAQQLNCDSFLRDYQKKNPHITLKDEAEFCKGVLDASREKKLIFMAIGDSINCTECGRYAYEKFNVILSGCTSMPEIFSVDYKLGYNHIMLSRIKERLGKDFRKLGIVRADWYTLNDSFFKTILSNLEATSINEDTVLVQLNMQKTDTLNSILVKGLDSKRSYSFEQLYEGIALKKKYLNDKVVIKIDYAHYNAKNYCKVGYGPTNRIIAVPF